MRTWMSPLLVGLVSLLVVASEAFAAVPGLVSQPLPGSAFTLVQIAPGRVARVLMVGGAAVDRVILTPMGSPVRAGNLIPAFPKSPIEKRTVARAKALETAVQARRKGLEQSFSERRRQAGFQRTERENARREAWLR